MEDRVSLAQGMGATTPRIGGDQDESRAPWPGSTRPVGDVLDAARIAALHDLGLLDSEAEEEFDRYTRLATELFGVPVSLVSLVDAPLPPG